VPREAVEEFVARLRSSGTGSSFGSTPTRTSADSGSPRSSRRTSRSSTRRVSNRLEALYVVALTTGMREGELLGLRWTDVDLDEAALHVTRRLKRRTSRHQVLLVAPAVQALKFRREHQDDERRQASQAWDDRGLVFPNTIGRPIDPSNFLLRSFYRLLKQADLPRDALPRPTPQRRDTAAQYGRASEDRQ